MCVCGGVCVCGWVGGVLSHPFLRNSSVKNHSGRLAAASLHLSFLSFHSLSLSLSLSRSLALSLSLSLALSLSRSVSHVRTNLKVSGQRRSEQRAQRTDMAILSLVLNAMHLEINRFLKATDRLKNTTIAALVQDKKGT